MRARPDPGVGRGAGARAVTLLLLAVLLWACRQSAPRSLGGALPAVPPPDTTAEAMGHEGAGSAGVEQVSVAVAAEPVRGFTGPGGLPFEVTRRTMGQAGYLYRRMGLETFAIALRGSGLSRYPCSSCHTAAAPLPRLVPGTAGTHRDIQPVHPARTGARCTTCHLAPGMDRLAVAAREVATLDQAYRLCAQCHFRQAAGWAAGAHGKRLEGWQGRRVVLNCTDCHDPHQPRIERRIPFPGPALPGHQLQVRPP